MKKILSIAAIGILLVGAGSVIYSRLHYGRNTLPAQYHSGSSAQQAGSLDHVVIIVEENKPEKSIINNPAAPYINRLAATYARAGNYYAVTNPSLPNYLALTSGTTSGFTSDCNPPGGSCVAQVPNIADRIEAAGKSWKAYMESMPSPCYAANSGNYAVKHNPFLYYPDIADNALRCRQHDVPYGQFLTDLQTASSLPDYSFISPDLCNDMHNCSIGVGDNWLAAEVPKILGSEAFTHQHSLLVITWDEGNVTNNNVPVIFAGPAAKKSYVSHTYYSHYSLLHTIESAWKLPSLTDQDGKAPLMTDMLK